MYSSNPIQTNNRNFFSNKAIRLISLLLVIIGALNWGVIGLNGYNFVEALVGVSWARPIYITVGLAGVLEFVSALYWKMIKI